MDFQSLKTLFARFNRKERYHLVSYACGGFGPSDALCEDVKKVLGLEIDKKTAWMAMDYHLDWLSTIFALLTDGSAQTLLSESAKDPESRRPNDWKGNARHGLVIEGNQQDLDLLILAQEKGSDEIHLIMVEAKLDSGWTNAQLKTKGKRLQDLFPGRILKFTESSITIHCHLIMMDPRDDYGQKAALHCLPKWARSKSDDPRSIPKLSLRPKGADVLLKPVRMGGQDTGGVYPDWHVETVSFEP